MDTFRGASSGWCNIWGLAMINPGPSEHIWAPWFITFKYYQILIVILIVPGKFLLLVKQSLHILALQSPNRAFDEGHGCRDGCWPCCPWPSAVHLQLGWFWLVVWCILVHCSGMFRKKMHWICPRRLTLLVSIVLFSLFSSFSDFKWCYRFFMIFLVRPRHSALGVSQSNGSLRIFKACSIHCVPCFIPGHGFWEPDLFGQGSQDSWTPTSRCWQGRNSGVWCCTQLLLFDVQWWALSQVSWLYSDSLLDIYLLPSTLAQKCLCRWYRILTPSFSKSLVGLEHPSTPKLLRQRFLFYDYMWSYLILLYDFIFQCEV